MSETTLSRRRLLLTTGSVSALALAGCVGDDDSAGDGTDDDQPGDDDETQGGSADEIDDADEEDDPDGQTGFPIDGEFSLPEDPDDDDFVDYTGEDAVQIDTIQRDEDPQFVFDPPFVRVDEGTTIRWVNQDGVFHTVTSTPDLSNRSGGGDLFDEQISSVGDEFVWEAAETGRQDYYCSPHAGFMYGSIDVV